MRITFFCDVTPTAQQIVTIASEHLDIIIFMALPALKMEI
jgi:hypothetical protein